MTGIKRLLQWQYLIIVVFVVELVVLSILSPSFGRVSNLFSITENFVVIGLLALPLTWVIITGGIDLSIGSITSLGAVVTSLLYTHGMNIWLACLGGIIVGAVCGIINSLIIIYTGVQPLIATLATMFIYASAALVLLGQQPIKQFPAGFLLLGDGLLFGVVPLQLILLILFALVFGFVFKFTAYGRLLRFIGYNEPAARYSGLKVDGVKASAYIVSGIIASIAGDLLISYFASVRADIGSPYLLTVVTACLLGGVSIFGGAGTILGTVFGALIIGYLEQGLNFLNVSSSEQSIVVGIILLLAVGIQQFSNMWHKRGRSESRKPVEEVTAAQPTA